MSIIHHTNRDIENRARKFNELVAKVKSIERSLIKLQGGGTTISDDTRGVTESAIVLDDITDLSAIAGDRLQLTGTRLDVEITPIETIGDPSYVTLEDLINVLHSAGAITGGAISDAGGETIDVAAGTGFIRTSDDPTVPLLSFDWDEETGLAIPTDTSRHVGIEYNAGVPQVLITDTDSDFNEHDNFHLGDVVNEGGTLHIQNIPHNVGNAVGHIIERLVETTDPQAVGGLILGESADANRYITVTAGSIWNRLTESVIGAFDSSGADRFDIYHRDGGAGFTLVANQQAWDMDSFDDGNIAGMGANKYAVMWFYMEFDGGLVAQYGRGEYVTQGLAENEEVPATAPDRITEHAILIGRLIFKVDTTPALAVETVFTTTFNKAGVTSHAELAGIATDDHHTLYTDAEAIAAVEAEATLDLAGELSLLDSKKITLGTGGDLEILHDGANRFRGVGGAIIIDQNAAGGNIQNSLGGRFVVQDADDGDAILFDLDTSARTQKMGAAADPLATTHTGVFNVAAGGINMDGADTDDEALKVPYLSQAPGTLVNGMIWMESDGLHIYYDGGEKLVAGV